MDSQSLRNFRDFLQQYNTIAEGCFNQCVFDLTSGGLSPDEATCVDKCSYKFVKTNNRAMQVYMEVQPVMTQRRIDDMNKSAVSPAESPTIPDEQITSELPALSETSNENNQ